MQPTHEGQLMFGNSLLSQALQDEQRKLAVWAKGTPIIGYPETVYRRDYTGRAMRYSDYGNRSSNYGWEFGHIVAAALGGSGDISNLRPENWETNASAGGLLSNFLAR